MGKLRDFFCPKCERVTVALEGATIYCSRSTAGADHPPKKMKQRDA